MFKKAVLILGAIIISLTSQYVIAGKLKKAVLAKMEIERFEALVVIHKSNAAEMGRAFRNTIVNNMHDHANILIKHRVDVNSTCSANKTALWHALDKNLIDMVILLSKQEGLRTDLPSEREIVQLIGKRNWGFYMFLNKNLEVLFPILTTWQKEYIEKALMNGMAIMLGLTQVQQEGMNMKDYASLGYSKFFSGRRM